MTVPSYLQPTEASPDKTGATIVPLFIENNGFFPRIELRDFETRYQVDKSFSEARRLNLLQVAMQQTNDELMEQVCTWQRSGYYELSAVPQQKLGDCGEFDLVYRQAVYAKTMQLLNERYRGTDTKHRAVPKAEAMEQVAEEYEIEFRRAIYTLTGQRGQSVCVELI